MLVVEPFAAREDPSISISSVGEESQLCFREGWSNQFDTDETNESTWQRLLDNGTCLSAMTGVTLEEILGGTGMIMTTRKAATT